MSTDYFTVGSLSVELGTTCAIDLVNLDLDAEQIIVMANPLTRTPATGCNLLELMGIPVIPGQIINTKLHFFRSLYK